MNHTDVKFHAASISASIWLFGQELLRHGPTWDLLPSILLASSTFVIAVRGYLDAAQARRHREEKHRAEIAKFVPMPFIPGIEKLN